MNMGESLPATDQNIEECIMYLSGEGNYIFGDEVSIDQYDYAIVKSLGKQLVRVVHLHKNKVTLDCVLLKNIVRY